MRPVILCEKKARPPKEYVAADALAFVSALTNDAPDPLDWGLTALERLLRAIEAGDLAAALAEVEAVREMTRLHRRALHRWEAALTEGIRGRNRLTQRMLFREIPLP